MPNGVGCQNNPTKGRGALVEKSQMTCVSAVATGRYANLQVTNSGDDRSKVSRRGQSKAICRKSISEGENRELIGRRGVCRSILFTRDMSDIVGKLRNKIQVASFAKSILVRLRAQCESKRTGIGVDYKLPAL